MNTQPMTPEQHRERHIALHRSLDELFADYIRRHQEQVEFLQMPIGQLIQWSHEQTITPTQTVEP